MSRRALDNYFVPGNMYEYKLNSKGIRFTAYQDKDLSAKNWFALEDNTLCMFIGQDKHVEYPYGIIFSSLIFLTSRGEKIWIITHKCNELNMVTESVAPYAMKQFVKVQI